MSSKAYQNGPAIAYTQPQRPVQRRPLIIAFVGAFVFFVIFFSTSSVSEVSTVAKDAAKHMPRLPWQKAVHTPAPSQKNSTSGDTEWYSDFKWLNPFSSSITFDETRSVLPPLQVRPTVYTYYDAEGKSDKLKAAENDLLLIWRRAWWAQGFTPVILGRAEALHNPLYEISQGKKLEPAVESELMRLLAWSHMGGGIMANWLALPMGSHDDNLISYLRQNTGQYPDLSCYKGLGNGLYSGEKPAVDAAISKLLTSPKLLESKTFLELVEATDPKLFVVAKHSGIAFYDSAVLKSDYKTLAEALHSDQAAGLASLAELISSHLHATFLSLHPSGFNILAPFTPDAHILALPAIALASSLTTCPPSLLPKSCPPNIPKCTPCRPLPILPSPTYTNTSTSFTLASIPHPLTLAILLAHSSTLTVRLIRRHTARDPYLTATTAALLGQKISAYDRITPFKDNIASPRAAALGLWTTAEDPWLSWTDLDWHFGFALPRAADSKTVTPTDPAEVLELLQRAFPSPSTGSTPSTNAVRASDLKSQTQLLKQGVAIVKAGAKKSRGSNIMGVAEGWNLADGEAWRFVKAFEAREQVERGGWEEAERKFGGVEEGMQRGRGWF